MSCLLSISRLAEYPLWTTKKKALWKFIVRGKRSKSRMPKEILLMSRKRSKEQGQCHEIDEPAFFIKWTHWRTCNCWSRCNGAYEYCVACIVYVVRLVPEPHHEAGSFLESLELPCTRQVCIILCTQCFIENYFCKTGYKLPVGQVPSLHIRSSKLQNLKLWGYPLWFHLRFDILITIVG